MEAKSLKQKIIDKAVEARLLVPVREVEPREQPVGALENRLLQGTESPMLDTLTGAVAQACAPRMFRPHFSEANKRSPLDPSGIFLSTIVGTAGVLTLLKGAWQIAIPCLGLAGLGLFFSQRRFDSRENEDDRSSSGHLVHQELRQVEEDKRDNG